MKKLVALVLAAMLLTTGCSTKAPEAAGGMKAGTYKASAAGFHGDITLEVTVDAEKITDIQVIEHSRNRRNRRGSVTGVGHEGSGQPVHRHRRRIRRDGHVEWF